MNGLRKASRTLLWFTPFLVSLLINSFVFSSVTVSGRSMEPSFHNGQRLIMSRIDKNYERGEIVVFKAGGNDLNAQNSNMHYIKRVIAVAGDEVEYKDGKIFVNNREVNQSYLKDSIPDMINADKEKSDGTAMPYNNNWTLADLSKSNKWNFSSKNKQTVPDGMIFVMGDHRSNSSDSRYWGFVNVDTVDGVVKQMPFSNDQINSVINQAKENFFVS